MDISSIAKGLGGKALEKLGDKALDKGDKSDKSKGEDLSKLEADQKKLGMIDKASGGATKKTQKAAEEVAKKSSAQIDEMNLKGAEQAQKQVSGNEDPNKKGPSKGADATAVAGTGAALHNQGMPS